MAALALLDSSRDELNFYESAGRGMVEGISTSRCSTWEWIFQIAL